ncbi:hypothetical protein [Candidatus Palauibacter sp.]|uniref:hypothetical protein n=1 Tax=Candidatus Palauibacter sp. TaxID=3101350 RepID=UPI003B01B109
MSEWRGPPGSAAAVRIEGDLNTEAVCLAFEAVLGHLAKVVGDLMDVMELTPETLPDVRQELDRHIAKLADDSLLPLVVRGMTDQGLVFPDFRADFDQAFARAVAVARRELARNLEKLPLD